MMNEQFAHTHMHDSQSMYTSNFGEERKKDKDVIATANGKQRYSLSLCSAVCGATGFRLVLTNSFGGFIEL